MKTGFIGLGAMGSPMAANLARAGFLEAVWNRTRAKADALAQSTGVAVASDPAALAARCDVVLLSVAADHDVIAMIEALLPAVRPGTVVVDTSTVRADTARRCAERLAYAGAQFLDAPVSGGVEGARNGALAMMVGGAAQALDRVRPVLESVAQRIVHMGLVGAGQATKAVNQVMAAGINQAVSEALAFAAALDLPLDRVIDVVGGGGAGNWFLSHRGPGMAAGRFEPGFRVALHRKDLEICQQMAQTFGAHLPLVEMTLVHYRRLMDAGFGDADISVLFRAKQEQFSKE